MATYIEIQDYVKQKHGYTIKTCWIAHVKELTGLKPNIAPNRESRQKRKHPCPREKQTAIEEALRDFGMI